MELGVGIHGEPGRERVPLAAAREIAEMLVEPMLADLPFTTGDKVIAFVNGLGGTPLIELYVMYNEVDRDPRRLTVCMWRGRWSVPTSPHLTWQVRR